MSRYCVQKEMSAFHLLEKVRKVFSLVVAEMLQGSELYARMVRKPMSLTSNRLFSEIHRDLELCEQGRATQTKNHTSCLVS